MDLTKILVTSKHYFYFILSLQVCIYGVWSGMLTEDSIQSMGGKARAEALSDEEKSAIAKKAAEARWNVPRATHMGTIALVGRALPCYVLEDGRRMLSQRGLQTSIGLGTG